jgi:rhamnosyltransferase
MRSETAVIKVLFHEKNISRNELKRMSEEFRFFLIVNNSTDEIDNCFSDLSNILILNNLNHNGLAGAYNLGISYLMHTNPKYILFLDEDTPVDKIFDLLNLDLYDSFISKQVAAVAPNYIDSISMTKGLHLLLHRFSFKKISRDFVGISKVSFMINSFSIWRYEALLNIGNYDELMKIDLIDTDYCLRAVKMGYDLILNSNYVFVHKIGDRISYRFMSREFRSGNHGPFRRSLIMQNLIILLRKHFRLFPILLVVVISRIVYEFMGIILAEKNKVQKVKMSFIGLFNGCFASIKS